MTYGVSSSIHVLVFNMGWTLHLWIYNLANLISLSNATTILSIFISPGWCCSDRFETTWSLEVMESGMVWDYMITWGHGIWHGVRLHDHLRSWNLASLRNLFFKMLFHVCTTVWSWRQWKCWWWYPCGLNGQPSTSAWLSLCWRGMEFTATYLQCKIIFWRKSSDLMI